MSDRRLDLLLAGLLAGVVFAGATASSVETSLISTGRDARLVLFLVLAVVALAAAWRRRSEWVLRPWVAAAVAAFCVLALDSAAWSVASVYNRAVSLAVVASVALILAGSSARRPDTRLALLDGILVGCGALALAGLVLWLVDASAAVQPATVEYPARFQGFEQNPDTGPMLLAIGMPIALRRVLAEGSTLVRGVSLLLVAGFAAEIAASGSRGALLAGFGSALVVVALSLRARPARLAGSALVIGALAVCAWATTIPNPLPGSAPAPAGVPHVHRAIDAERVMPLEQEIGSPWWTHRRGSPHRGLFTAGSRLRALRGSIHQALGRPILGVGFGVETFVDRYYGFHSGNPEDGYVGLFMQIGAVGIAVFMTVVALCVWPALMRGARRDDPAAVPALGAVTAGLMLGLSQSYFHAPGNVAFVAFWVTLVLASVSGRAVEAAQ